MSSDTYLRWSYRHFHSKLLPHTLIFLLIPRQTRFVQRRYSRNFKQRWRGRSFLLWDIFPPSLCSSAPFFIISLSIMKPKYWRIVEANKGTSALDSTAFFFAFCRDERNWSHWLWHNSPEFSQCHFECKDDLRDDSTCAQKRVKDATCHLHELTLVHETKGHTSQVHVCCTATFVHTRSEENSDSNWNCST